MQMTGIALQHKGAFDELLTQLDKARWFDLNHDLEAAQATNRQLTKSLGGAAESVQQTTPQAQADQLVKALDNAARLCELGKIPPQQLIRLEVLVNKHLARLL